MYIITVEFEVNPGDVAPFRDAVLLQAENSLTKEPGCRIFDVAQSSEFETKFFLYEIYDDRAAFEAHLETDHFCEFDQLVQPYVQDKQVVAYDLISPARTD